jgi:SAM-dependent methyltransferase
VQYQVEEALSIRLPDGEKYNKRDSVESFLRGVRLLMGSKLRPLLGGIKSHIPFLPPANDTQGINLARYSYSVWLRHLVVAYENGLDTYPRRIVEIGQDDPFGIGLAGLIAGATHYYAFDVSQSHDSDFTTAVFDELTSLFKQRATIPGDDEFPEVYPHLSSYQFPTHVLTGDLLEKALDKSRLNTLRKQLASIPDRKNRKAKVQVLHPDDSDVIEEESIDMICSQAALEHIDDLAETYQTQARWLKKGGILSHQIDFRSHGVTDDWNGHWTYSNFMWKFISGHRPHPLNRAPLSVHTRLLQSMGFRVICILPVRDLGGLNRCQLNRLYKYLPEEIVTTCSAHIISVKE